MTGTAAGAPDLRFPQFAGDWIPKRGGDAFDQRRERGEGGLPLYSVTIDRGIVRRDSLDREISSAMADEGNLRVKKDDIAYNMMRMWQGAVGRAFGDGMVSPAYVVLSPKAASAPAFFEHWFKRARSLHLLWAYSHGLTDDRLRLYFRDFSKVPMVLPDRSEQQKIADFLGLVDERIVLLARKAVRLTDHKREVARRLFTRELRFRRRDGSHFPEWEGKSLGELARRVTERNQLFEHSLVLTNSAVHGIVNQQDFFDKEIANQENIDAYYVVRGGDFVYNPRISVSAPVGPIRRSGIAVGVMSPLYTVFRFHSGNEKFFDQYFASNQWHRYMRSIANYGARHDRMAITSADFMSMPLPLPHPDEQERIADFLFALDEKIAVVGAKVAAMKAFKKGLLQQMFV